MTMLKPGDVVMLKSGGPVMTIKDYGLSKSFFKCTWFVGDDQKSGIFSEVELELYRSEEEEK